MAPKKDQKTQQLQPIVAGTSAAVAFIVGMGAASILLPPGRPYWVDIIIGTITLLAIVAGLLIGTIRAMLPPPDGGGGGDVIELPPGSNFMAPIANMETIRIHSPAPNVSIGYCQSLEGPSGPVQHRTLDRDRLRVIKPDGTTANIVVRGDDTYPRQTFTLPGVYEVQSISVDGGIRGIIIIAM